MNIAVFIFLSKPECLIQVLFSLFAQLCCEYSNQSPWTARFMETELLSVAVSYNNKSLKKAYILKQLIFSLKPLFLCLHVVLNSNYQNTSFILK